MEHRGLTWWASWATGIMLMTAALGPAFADDQINGMLASWCAQMQSDLVGAIMVFAPYALVVGLILGGVIFVLGFIRLVSKRTAG